MSQWKIDKEDLIFKTKIGKGNFGEVWDGEYLGTRVAIKKLFFVNDELMQKYIEREMDTLTNLAHPNIVQFMGLCIELEDIFIITEFVSGGDLRSKLKDTSSEIDWKTRLSVAKDLAAAMNFLHTKQIVHRDLKSHNLLVGEGWKVKVCDFGLARAIDKKPEDDEPTQPAYMTIVGTNEWMAPEVMLGLDYDFKCDVFSYAMVLYELITRDKPPQRNVGKQFAFDEPACKKNIPKETPAELWNLLVECAERNPEMRPGFKEIIKKVSEIIKRYEEDGWPAVSKSKKKGKKKSKKEHKHKKGKKKKSKDGKKSKSKDGKKSKSKESKKRKKK